jgi:hypothetical protein
MTGLVVLALCLAKLPPVFGRVLNCLPVILMVSLGLMAAEFRRERDPIVRERLSVGIGLSVFALALTAKMLLNVRIPQYGFGLAMPATVVVIAFLSEPIPAVVRRWSGGTGHPTRGVAIAIALFLWFSVAALSSQLYEAKVWQLGSGDDLLHTDPRGEVLDSALSRIRELEPRSMVVLPEGVILNYLARVPNPTPYFNFIPPELLMFGEEQIVRALENVHPDVVVLVHRDASTYGLPYFGRDYGAALDSWARLNYSLDSRFGREPFKGSAWEFGVDVMVPRAPGDAKGRFGAEN